MSNCSINTECQCDSLVAAIRDVLDSRDEDFSFSPTYRSAVFRTQYPRLSDAIDHAGELISSLEEKIA